MITGVSPRRMGQFTWAHLGWVALAPALMILGTTLHELAHAAVAVLQGGHLEQLRLLPHVEGKTFYFGRVWYSGATGDTRWVDLAPAALAVAIASVGPWLVRRCRPGPWAKLALLAVFVLPMFDLTLAGSGLAFGRSEADWFKALAGHAVLALAALAAFVAWQVPRGYRAFVHACGPALSQAEFALGAGLIWGLGFLRWGLVGLAGG